MSIGGDDPTTLMCASCGNSTSPNDQFCRQCGAGLNTSQEITLPRPAAPASGDPTTAAPDVVVTLGPSTPPSGTVLRSDAAPPGPDPAPSPPSGSRRPVIIAAAAGAVLLVLVLVVVLALTLGSGPDEQSVTGPALVAGEPVTVSLEGDTAAARVHQMRMSRGDTATVFVTSARRFAPTVAVAGPSGEPVATEVIALGSKGAAATFTATEDGPQSVAISNFSDAQRDYQVERRNVRFRTPEELAVGDCVSRYGDETWAHVSGFTVRSCDRAHEGQVFEQVPGFGDEESDAQTQCDIARNQRVHLPGYVEWRAYWGDDLTCIVVADNGTGTLDRTLVTPD